MTSFLSVNQSRHSTEPPPAAPVQQHTPRLTHTALHICLHCNSSALGCFQHLYGVQLSFRAATRHFEPANQSTSSARPRAEQGKSTGAQKQTNKGQRLWPRQVYYCCMYYPRLAIGFSFFGAPPFPIFIPIRPGILLVGFDSAHLDSMSRYAHSFPFRSLPA